MFLQVSVSHSVHRGGVRGCSKGGVGGCSGGCSWGGWRVWDMTRYGDTINERAVRILLECILVYVYELIFGH